MIPFKKFSRSFQIRLTPETSSYLLSMARADERRIDDLHHDLWSSTRLVDQFGRTLR